MKHPMDWENLTFGIALAAVAAIYAVALWIGKG